MYFRQMILVCNCNGLEPNHVKLSPELVNFADDRGLTRVHINRNRQSSAESDADSLRAMIKEKFFPRGEFYVDIEMQ